MQDILQKLHVAENPAAIGNQVANRIANVVRKKPHAVLGLATGSSPIPIYESLIQLHRDGLDFSHVTTFNLDEYYPMDTNDPCSYHAFMRRHLFDHVAFLAHHIPDGRRGTTAQIAMRCDYFDHLIRRSGGIDFQLAGIGRNGHVGFNEPGSLITNVTQLITLDEITRQDAAADFGGLAHVPRQAITMGLRTIKSAREIAMIITGDKKADIAYRALTEPVSRNLPATLLRDHPGLAYYMDKAAAAKLLAALPKDLAMERGYVTPSLSALSL